MGAGAQYFSYFYSGHFGYRGAFLIVLDPYCRVTG